MFPEGALGGVAKVTNEFTQDDGEAHGLLMEMFKNKRESHA